MNLTDKQRVDIIAEAVANLKYYYPQTVPSETIVGQQVSSTINYVLGIPSSEPCPVTIVEVYSLTNKVKEHLAK